MLIPVMFKDGKFGYTDKYKIDRLINARQIIKFRRSNGWVIIGRDAIRHKTCTYQGVERRQLSPRNYESLIS